MIRDKQLKDAKNKKESESRIEKMNALEHKEKVQREIEEAKQQEKERKLQIMLAAKNNQLENDKIKDMMRKKELDERNMSVVGNNLLTKLFEVKVQNNPFSYCVGARELREGEKD